MRTLRVLTLNLWGRSGAWEERRVVIAQGLRHLEPDLIALSAMKPSRRARGLCSPPALVSRSSSGRRTFRTDLGSLCLAAGTTRSGHSVGVEPIGLSEPPSLVRAEAREVRLAPAT